MSLSNTPHPHCLVLVNPGSRPKMKEKIVDLDVKPQTNKSFSVSILLCWLCSENVHEICAK